MGLLDDELTTNRAATNAISKTEFPILRTIFSIVQHGDLLNNLKFLGCFYLYLYIGIVITGDYKFKQLLYETNYD